MPSSDEVLAWGPRAVVTVVPARMTWPVNSATARPTPCTEERLEDLPNHPLEPSPEKVLSIYTARFQTLSVQERGD